MPKLQQRNLTPIVEQTADYVRRRAPKRRRITIDVDLPDPFPARVNEELFAWVVENLLKNALDAIDDDEGAIEITGFDDGEAINIDVRDTGSGIDRREWRNVFRPGYSTKKRGWGLGLSLAQRVVEDYHGGTIRIQTSTPGDGSTFRIELPRA